MARHQTPREQPGPIPTLRELQHGNGGKWVWVYCESIDCHHRAPMALAPLIIRWGPGVSSNKLRHCARCTRCGHKGATLSTPSWIHTEGCCAPFPACALAGDAPSKNPGASAPGFSLSGLEPEGGG